MTEKINIPDPTSICDNREISPHSEFAVAVDDKKIDLVEERKKYKSKPEDKVILPEQVETGNILDSAFHKELMLRNNPKEFPIADYTKILYRLPINEKQMQELHNKLISNQ